MCGCGCWPGGRFMMGVPGNSGMGLLDEGGRRGGLGWGGARGRGGTIFGPSCSFSLVKKTK